MYRLVADTLISKEVECISVQGKFPHYKIALKNALLTNPTGNDARIGRQLIGHRVGGGNLIVKITFYSIVINHGMGPSQS
jgi:hypothetical protein